MSETSFLRPLVFDLDGTLIDSRRDIAAAANHALAATGRRELSVEQIAGYVGNGAGYLLECCARATTPDVPVDEARQEMTPHFFEYYQAHPAVFSRALPGVEAALGLAGRKLAVCTNKPREVTELVLRDLGWKDRFEVVVAAGDTTHKKPHPEPLLLVAERLGVDAAQLIMIGDGPQDVLAGKAAGAHTIGVRGGLLPEVHLEESEPDVILASLEELAGYLGRNKL